jgi:transcriptional regulator with GAF, ATPase, and Fis domain
MSKKFDETADIQSMRGVAAAELWLVISSASGVRALPLPRSPKVMIGRLHTCDVVVDDESVSRQHAAIHAGQHGLFIEDLGSRNKTKVMGRALGRGETAPLPPGSVVEIGYVTMFVQTGRPGVARASSPGMAASAPAGTGPVGSADAPVILDPTMQRLYALLEVIAPSPLNVVILGETGTGKEVFAEAIHTGSRRAHAPFLRINCAALAGSLLESELFGHEKGAFTGALGAKAGLFEAADGGTVFLDEIGEMPIETQAKLLRVIERGEVMRLGSVQPRRVDVRYVAATNRDLQQFIAEGKFRSDLFFRLNGFSVTLPPLRKRPKEILALANLFLVRAAQGKPLFVTPDAQATLLAYPWPGNVRELKNVLERALVLAGPSGRIDPIHLQLPEVRAPLDPGEVTTPNDTIPPTPYASGALPGTWPPPPVAYAQGPVPAAMGSMPVMPPMNPQMMPLGATPPMGVAVPGGAASDLRAQRESWERQQILQALEKTSGNQKEAAKLLGISRRTLINKIEAYGIARPRKKT